ncbi:MAG: NAD(P)-dependent oxidoreductase [Piscirickettsiaceae bacterium CG_4_9_14_3_um_filter_43_564]|nr:SDR family oxidoreductase [Thiomicrospira sp.]OIP96679.1 MAG: NAD(P)-dependent oxidoreductase [Thiomicrospira sp. CG2_30_44_34]PIQ05032.1 MAG: NAD(P)-dependent oxidoreductase [Piscirickettsiaceae bacterium CG18_big_fil_WC_8_21_14_2_50_44_103]PIU37961.1 MAG: NAD(P)-dependent oxidoreductase [Piscirickettsiaceae bacterium CG07_land_8_20_14_0_80_44_28]PIW58130.1 MAG: NAD(P)-dependent oxidoreductase [Piscirickettsiaceae bacterium CG12_big_fil_rev_8_21_14_0_65_44_934]PIW78127.1 MAG: NAD(P)-depend
MARVLIAGCGKLGNRLGQNLAAEGHDVFGIRRDGSKIEAPIQPIEADLFAPLPELPSDLDYVYYIVSAKTYNDLAYYKAYVLGLKHVIEALKGQTIKRLFFVSSSSVFGQSDGESVTEESLAEAKNFSSRRLLEGEEIAHNSPFPATVIRFGGIYGPGRTYLIDMVLQGKANCMEDVYSNRIHSEDCVGMLEHLMQVTNPEPLYIGVDNESALTCDVYEWLAEQLSVASVTHREPTENSRMQRSNKRLSNAKITATGYQFKYPSYREGYGEMLEKMS